MRTAAPDGPKVVQSFRFGYIPSIVRRAYAAVQSGEVGLSGLTKAEALMLVVE